MQQQAHEHLIVLRGPKWGVSGDLASWGAMIVAPRILNCFEMRGPVSVTGKSQVA